MQPGERIVGVWLLTGVEKVLHYKVASSMAENLGIGWLVRVPIGRRFNLAIVCEVDSEPDVSITKLKLVSQVCYDHSILTESLMKLVEWMSGYYGCKRNSVLEVMIPAPARHGANRKMETLISVERKLDKEELAALAKKAPKQKALYEFVSQQFRPQKKSLILKRLETSAATCMALVKKRILKEESRVVERVAYDDDLGDVEFAVEKKIVLNEEQAIAAERISESVEAGRFETRLLQGVTGSGKTEVYLNAMARALDAGKSVLFLVPEVALTPQTVGRIRSRFSGYGSAGVVVWHSHLSDGERLDAWMAIATGVAKIVVGARSAVFAPFEDLGLIIVDEEHEPAFKQDETPRYHGRDVAVYRAFLEGCTCILGSATPSMETYRNVQLGKYEIDRLTQRVDNRSLPMMHVVDMRAEVARSRKPQLLSGFLIDKLQNRFAQGEQSILFINRRGFSSSMICQECGYVAMCEHCSVAMTYHRTDETLKCHMCGHEEEAPMRCKECRSPKIRGKGMGTQRIEEAARRVLPNAKIERIDADTMSRKHLFREILGRFRSGKIDLLVGTQMIAKGLDFPNVTLVGMVDADLSLHVPDFRANERTFQLLVQVSGRSGRGDLAGEVVIQTFTPHAEAIQFARRGEVDEFLELEASGREEFNYPPFRHLTRQLFRGPNEDKVIFFAEQFAKRAEKRLGDWVEMRGPAPCAIEKIKGQYRFQIWYFAKNLSKLMAELVAIAKEIDWPNDVIQVFDADPMNLT